MKYRKHRSEWSCMAVQGKRGAGYAERQRQYQRQYQRGLRFAKYGLAKSDFDEMVSAQAGRCAICLQLADLSLCIDHCHSTGAVRGLLCRDCNLALGLMADDPERLRSAARYLEK